MISWNRIAAIIRREYLERVKTKAFWISTLLVPIFLGAVMIIPAWLASRGGGTFTVAVLDFTGRFAEPIRAELDDMLDAPDIHGDRGPRRGRHHTGRTGRDHGRDDRGVSSSISAWFPSKSAAIRKPFARTPKPVFTPASSTACW